MLPDQNGRNDYHEGYLLIPVDQNDTKVCGHELPSCRNCDIIPLPDVVNVNWYRSVSSDAMFLHQSDQFRFCQVIWRRCLLFNEFDLLTMKFSKYTFYKIVTINYLIDIRKQNIIFTGYLTICVVHYIYSKIIINKVTQEEHFFKINNHSCRNLL